VGSGEVDPRLRRFAEEYLSLRKRYHRARAAAVLCA
jgi:hypothetical protein